MFKIYVDGQVLYDPRITDDGYVVTSASVDLQLNGAGSAEFTIPSCNPLYNSINKLKSIVEIYKDDEQIFRGRVLHDERDFNNNKDVYCEGELSFLMDNVVSPRGYHDKTVAEVFAAYIEIYNGQVEANKRFTVGTVDVQGTVDYYNYDFALLLDEINKQLIEPFGGYLRTRYENGVHYIDYLANYTHVCDQTIEFGMNLLDYTEYVSAENIFTILIPLGKEIKDADGNYIGRVNIKSVTTGNVEFVESIPARNIFGNVWKIEIFDDIEDPSELKSAGEALLNKNLTEATTITISAIDLNLVNVNAEAIRLGDGVRVFSAPHGVDHIFQCSKISYDLMNPANSKYEFGTQPASISRQTAQLSSNVRDLFYEPRESFTDEEIDMMREEILKSIPTFNLVPSLYYYATLYGTVYESNGITWTANADGSVTARGTADSENGSGYSINGVGTLALSIDPNKSYTLSGCPSGGGSDYYAVACRAYTANETPTWGGGTIYRDFGSGVTIPAGYKYVSIYLWIYPEYACPSNGVTFLPMLEVGETKHSFVSTATNSATLISDISQNASNIQSKVSTTDYNGETLVSLINQSASTVIIDASHISLSGKTINLTSNNIQIASTNFSVSSTGHVIGNSFEFGAIISLPPVSSTAIPDVWIRHAAFVSFGVEILSGTESNSPYVDFNRYITDPDQHDVSHDHTARIVNNSNDTISFYGRRVSASVTNQATLVAGTYANGSDRRLKRQIKALTSESSKQFISSLKPLKFEYRNSPGITHHGFIYDEVEKIKNDSTWSVSSMIEDYMGSGDSYGTISINEIVPDLVAVVQQQMQEIAELKQKMSYLGY